MIRGIYFSKGKDEIHKRKSKESIETQMLKNEDLFNPHNLTEYLKGKNIPFLENFELQDLVGKGRDSYVYRTLVKKNGRFICSKFSKREKIGKLNINEYEISKKLKHQNIVNTIGASTIKKNELDLIMMEYARNGNLRDFQINSLRRYTLSESFLCYISRQILIGLKYMHMCKIAHFDLKPQNIIIDDYLNCKIIDFSVSLDYSQIKSKTIALPFRGTNFYISPQVIKGEKINVSDLNKIDLYSLGVILHKFAFNSYPYDLSSEDSLNYGQIYNKINKKWEVKDDKLIYSSHFIDFLNKLLEKDINKRINIDEALNHYWVKGSDILLDEKEKLFNANIFLSYLITNHFQKFNDYIKSKNIFFPSN